MSQFVIDQDTVSVKSKGLTNLFDYRVSNPFYLFAPAYYMNFYSMYLMPALALYNGTIDGVYDRASGFTTQRLLPSVMRGLSNLLFANGIDFSCADTTSYAKIKSWAKRTKFIKVLKKSYVNSGAGGTVLLKINRNADGELFVSQHRIDTFFVDVDSNNHISSAKIYIDMITNTVKKDEVGGLNVHYGLVEERYFNENGMPCIKASVYRGSANLQTETLARPMSTSTERVDWEQLPSNVRTYIKQNYPSIIIGKEQYLPFKDYLGLMIWTFTPDIPQIPNSPFGQPIGDILQTETLQYDQLKFFERNEVDLARARALVPEDYMNPDDPDNDNTALSDRFYQKISTSNADNDKITPIQFQLRANDIRAEKENILKDIAVKLQLSASTVASFLNEGSGARTATEIVSERTKTDTWIKSQISNVRDDLNEFIGYIARYYNIVEEIDIIFKCEDQSPLLDKMKVYSDVFSGGKMTPERYVKDVFGNLSQAEQEKEINYLSNMMQLDIQAKLNALLGNQPVQVKEEKPKEMANNENASTTAQVDRERIDNKE